MSGPLEGIRVLDMTGALMGPYTTQILGDLGADVIKVEPSQGDTTRWLGRARSPGMGPLFLHLNRSKRAIVIDLKKPAGRSILLKLAEAADVLVYNLRPQPMARLGLTYTDIYAVNPQIIYCGVFGYGQNGPYAVKPAYDDLIQGGVALPSLVAQSSKGEPRYVPAAVADRTVGLIAVYSINAALYYRERTGQGQAIEIPMFETMASFILSDHMYGRTFEPPLGESGYVRLLDFHRRPYATKDGYICALAYTDKHWQRFFDLVERPELKEDPRFNNMSSRTQNVKELYAFFAETLRTQTTAEWLDAFEKLDIPVMPLHTLDSLMTDPHLVQTGFFEIVEHPTEGKIRTMPFCGAWSKSAPKITRQAPRLGEHTVEILREVGYSDSEINKLTQEKIIVVGKQESNPTSGGVLEEKA